MITARIQIEDGPVQNSYTRWGFIPLGSGGEKKHFAAPEKKRDKSSYPEQSGVNEDPRTVDDEFDYVIEFLISTPNRNLVSANALIAAWNNAVRERTPGSDIKRCKTITLYDDRMRTRITGIPETIADVDADNFYRRQDGSVLDCVRFKLVIHVSNPTLCAFDINRGIGVMRIGSSFKVGDTTV